MTARRTAAVTALCLAAIALPGCDVLKRNEDALVTINQRVLGMPSGAFFDRYGRASSRTERDDGTVGYLWESRVGFARAGPAGLDDRVCRLRLSADKAGRIVLVEVELDAPGLSSTSRCNEIFQPA